MRRDTIGAILREVRALARHQRTGDPARPVSTRASKTSRFQWIGLIERYFESREELRAIGILVDARHIGLENDVILMNWLSEQEQPWFIVMTKIDKVKQQDIAAHEKYLKQEFPRAQMVFKTCSKDGKGIRTLFAYIKERVAAPIGATSE